MRSVRQRPIARITLQSQFDWASVPSRPGSPRCLRRRPIGTGNTFTEIEKIEFLDAIDTIWTDNSLPSETCLEDREDDSTFTGSVGLPVEC